MSISSIYTIISPPDSPNKKSAFLPNNYKTVAAAWSHGLNPDYWRHGLVFSQGHTIMVRQLRYEDNKGNVTPHRCRERCRFIAGRLLRKMFGNKYRDKAKLHFMILPEGPEEFTKHRHRHFHVLMGIEGEHNWSDHQIAEEIKTIDSYFLWEGEKPVHVDYDWKNGNRYHSYTTKSPQKGDTDWFV